MDGLRCLWWWCSRMGVRSHSARSRKVGSAFCALCLCLSVCLCPPETDILYFRLLLQVVSCVLPLTLFSPVGTGCTELPGVTDIACLSGKCIVHRFPPRHALAIDGTSCVPKHPRISHSHIASAEDEIESAKIYGLDHVPLERN